MKLAFVSRDKRRLLKNMETILKYRDNLSSDPEMVVAIGGDGSFIAAERFYPGVPKLAVRDQSICNKCDWDNLDEGIKRVLIGKFTIRSLSKIMGRINGYTVEALNDIVIRNAFPTHAIRFTLSVDGKRIGGEWIGDGLVISTAFGSEGYFRSITRQHFERGFGVAFNNTTRYHAPLFLRSPRAIVLHLTRGSAHVAVDNDPKIYVIPEGGKIVIRPSKEKARIVRLR